MLRKMSKGFTLIELMIVVAIIGILAAIAIPAVWESQCKKGNVDACSKLKPEVLERVQRDSDKNLKSEVVRKNHMNIN